jgi:hypothetical protein
MSFLPPRKCKAVRDGSVLSVDGRGKSVETGAPHVRAREFVSGADVRDQCEENFEREEKPVATESGRPEVRRETRERDAKRDSKSERWEKRKRERTNSGRSPTERGKNPQVAGQEEVVRCKRVYRN